MAAQRPSLRENRHHQQTVLTHLQSSIPVADSLLQFLQHGIDSCRALVQALLALQKLPRFLEVTHTHPPSTTVSSETPLESSTESGLTTSTQHLLYPCIKR